MDPADVRPVKMTLHAADGGTIPIWYPPREMRWAQDEARRWLREGYWSPRDNVSALHAVTRVDFEVDPEDLPAALSRREALAARR